MLTALGGDLDTIHLEAEAKVVSCLSLGNRSHLVQQKSCATYPIGASILHH